MTRLSYLMLAGALAAAGCSPRPNTPETRAADANYAACRARTDAIYDQQNRYLLSERSTIDSPYSTTGLPGNTAKGLSRQYQRDSNMQNCLDNGTAAAGSGEEGIVTVGPNSAPTPPAAPPAK